MTYLFTPPTFRMVAIMRRSLRCGVPTCTGVWRIDGTWFNSSTAGVGNPDETTIDVDAPTGIKLYFGRPTLVPDSLVSVLTPALTPADPTWTPGTLVHQ
jgi:hypothetical protein